MIDIRPLSETFGVEILGCDLTQPITPALRDAIYRAFLDHHVIAIRGQGGLSTDQVLRLSRCFGAELEPHVFTEYHHPDTPLIIVLSNRRDSRGREKGLKDAGTFWHSDVSYKDNPAKATLLYSLEVPEEGGDTLFCDLTAAYEALSKQMKLKLQSLEAEHDYTNTKRDIFDEGRATPPPPGIHPVIRTHAETGRKAIYINPAYTARIIGLSDAESTTLKDEIYAHCLQDKFRMTYRWRAGDVVVWDNAAVMHSATTKTLDPAKHRTLWRTIISGDAPVR